MKYAIKVCYKNTKGSPASNDWRTSHVYTGTYDEETANKILDKEIDNKGYSYIMEKVSISPTITIADSEGRTFVETIKTNAGTQTYTQEIDDATITVQIIPKPKSKYKVGQVVMLLSHNPNFQSVGNPSSPDYRIDSGTYDKIKIIYSCGKCVWLSFESQRLDLPEVWVRALKPEEKQ